MTVNSLSVMDDDDGGDNDDNNNNNKYISKALNPSISDLHEPQSTIQVQLKPSKQRNQRHQEKVGDGRVKGQGPSFKYKTIYTLFNSLT